MGEGARLSQRREPGAVARPSRPSAAGASKVRKVEHHAALPYAELPAFMRELRERDGVAARALEFTILTATRTGEALNARWAEIDLDDKLWTIPAERMKAGREHRVPLCDRAVAIVEEMPTVRAAISSFPVPSAASRSATWRC